jgi:hypothetical protein
VLNLGLLFSFVRCRQASRTAILALFAKLLPHSLPFGLTKPGSPAPAVLLTGFVDGQIAKFQARVTAKAAEHRAETRWWWQRRLDTFASNFRCVRCALGAALCLSLCS